MNYLDEQLVKDLLIEIAKYDEKRYSKFLDDDAEEMDIYEAADEIIKGLPWPIGKELMRLFTKDHNACDTGRVHQLLKTLERTMQFTSFILLSQLLEESIKKDIEIPLKFRAEFEKRFLMLTMGNYAWLIRNIGEIFRKQGIEPFTIELSGVLNEGFYKDLDIIVPERNEFGHYLVNYDNSILEDKCVEFENSLCNILKKISFLVRYKLVAINEIKVIKLKRKDPKFSHSFELLSYVSSHFKTKTEILDSFSDSYAILLMKDTKIPNEFLNLSPLVIDTRSESGYTIDLKKKNITKDIFLYTKFYRGTLHYIGMEATEQCDLTSLSNYQILVEQFNEYIDRFKSNTAEGV
jgi:hypothetical protein